MPIQPAFKHQLIERYLKAFPDLDQTNFWNSWYILTTHRILRLLGLYAKNDLNQETLNVTQFMPRLEQLLSKTLSHKFMTRLPAWQALLDWLEEHWYS